MYINFSIYNLFLEQAEASGPDTDDVIEQFTMHVQNLHTCTHVLYKDSKALLTPVKESVDIIDKCNRSQLPPQCTAAIEEVQQVRHTARSMDDIVYYSQHLRMKNAINNFNDSEPESSSDKSYDNYSNPGHLRPNHGS